MLHVASRNLGPRPPLSFEVEAATACAAAAASTCVPVPDPDPRLAVRLPLQHPARMLQPQHGTPTPTICAAAGAATTSISDPHFPLRLKLQQPARLLLHQPVSLSPTLTPTLLCGCRCSILRGCCNRNMGPRPPLSVRLLVQQQKRSPTPTFL